MSLFRISDFFPKNIIKFDGEFDQLDEAGSIYPGSLCYCQNLQFLDMAMNNDNVSAIITTEPLLIYTKGGMKAIVVAEDPRHLFFEAYAEIYKSSSLSDIECGLGENVDIHPSARISPMSYIGRNVTIGAGVVIGSGVRIMDDVYVDSNAVIGAEGLLTLRQSQGKLLRINHAGGVYIGARSGILSGAVIAKSLFKSPTTIGEDCQIGIMANIGHGATIGDQSTISGNTVVAGRVKVGRQVWMGVSSCIAQGLTIGDKAHIKMGSVVAHSIPSSATVSGNFAVSHKTHLRQHFDLKRRENI